MTDAINENKLLQESKLFEESYIKNAGICGRSGSRSDFKHLKFASDYNGVYGYIIDIESLPFDPNNEDGEMQILAENASYINSHLRIWFDAKAINFTVAQA